MSQFPAVSRRGLIGGAAALAAMRALPAWAAPADTPFTLGVASGDPTADGFVIWTRLAPQPLAMDGQGGLSGAIPVKWAVGADEGMRQIVASGVVQADDRFAHSVHVEPGGLEEGRPYWYRFEAMGAQSPIGRTLTLPNARSNARQLRFAFASCSHWELGYFSAYRHMAAENPDLVFFLGDYIYEYSNGPERADKVVRPHDRPGEISDLSGYRNRYALHHTDPDLQALHAGSPTVATWDDHEVENDYANKWSEHPETDPAAFLLRRAAAYQAFYEHMPLRKSSLPQGPDMRVYRRIRVGRLAEFTVLDGRQYRTIQPCPIPGWRGGHVADPACPDRAAPDRTMLGAAQEKWLHDGFRDADTQWNVVAQDLLIASFQQKDAKTGVPGHWTDGWDGYTATRDRMLKAVDHSKVRNPVFIGGDIHSFWANDLKADFDDPKSRTVATEFVGTSVTSDGPDYAAFAAMLPQNPHVKFFDSRPRGYVSVDIDQKHMETRFQAISDRRDPQATVSTLATFVVEEGQPGALMA